MAFCPNCGKPVTAEATKCVGCGKSLGERAKAGVRFKGTMLMTPGQGPGIGLPPPAKQPSRPDGQAPTAPKPIAAPPPAAGKAPSAPHRVPGTMGRTILGTGLAPTPKESPDTAPKGSPDAAQVDALAATARVSVEEAMAAQALIDAQLAATDRPPDHTTQATAGMTLIDEDGPAPAQPAPAPEGAAPQATGQQPGAGAVAMPQAPYAASAPRRAPIADASRWSQDTIPRDRTWLLVTIAVVGVLAIAATGYFVARAMGLTD